MFLRVIFLIFAVSFLAEGAHAEEGWVEFEDPREFLDACSFEFATPITFEEAALNYEEHLGECIKINGYYSLALYDGVDGFYQTDGDDWYGVPPAVLKRYRLGVYYPASTTVIYDFRRRNVTLAASLYTCEQWLKDAGKTNQDRDFLFHDYCLFQTGTIVVIHDWKLPKDQNFDPVVEFRPEIVDEEEGWVHGPHTVGFEVPECTFEEALKVDFIDVSLKPYLYWEKCLQLSALYGGMIIYDGLDIFNGNEGLYLARRHNPQSYESNRIGIFNYWNFEEILGWKEDGRVDVELAGLVSDCLHYTYSSRLARKRAFEIAQKKDPSINETIIVGGGCNYWGTDFYADQARKTGRRFERLTGPENRKNYGNLTVPDQDWVHLKAFTEAAREELQDNLDREPRNWQKPEDLPLQRYFALVEKLAGKRPELAFFLEETFPEYPHRIEVHGCFCLEEDCDGRWPISTLDVYYRPDLPYMCFKIDKDDMDDDPSGYPEW